MCRCRASPRGWKERPRRGVCVRTCRAVTRPWRGRLCVRDGGSVGMFSRAGHWQPRPATALRFGRDGEVRKARWRGHAYGWAKGDPGLVLAGPCTFTRVRVRCAHGMVDRCACNGLKRCPWGGAGLAPALGSAGTRCGGEAVRAFRALRGPRSRPFGRRGAWACANGCPRVCASAGHGPGGGASSGSYK